MSIERGAYHVAAGTVHIIAAGLICGYLGGMLDQKMMKKHFVKAGLVSVK